MELRDATKMATELMCKHGLPGMGWRLNVYDQYDGRMGWANSVTKVIGLSAGTLLGENQYGVEQLVLHEIAHAMVGPGHDHDATWRRMCVRIGALPSAEMFKYGRERAWLWGAAWLEPRAEDAWSFKRALMRVQDMMRPRPDFRGWHFWFRVPGDQLGLVRENDRWTVIGPGGVPTFKGWKRQAIEETATRLVLSFRRAA